MTQPLLHLRVGRYRGQVKCAVARSNYSIYAKYPESCVREVTRWFILFRKDVPAHQPAIAWRSTTHLGKVRLSRHTSARPAACPPPTIPSPDVTQSHGRPYRPRPAPR